MAVIIHLPPDVNIYDIVPYEVVVAHHIGNPPLVVRINRASHQVWAQLTYVNCKLINPDLSR